MAHPSGTCSYSRLVGQFRLDETIYAAGLSMPKHGHTPAYLSLVLTGGFSEKVALKTATAEAHSLVFRPEGSEHAVRFGEEPTKIFRLQVMAGTEMPTWPFRSNGPANSRWTVARIYDEFLKRGAACSLTLEELILRLLSNAGDPGPTAGGPKARAAREYLDTSFTGPISLQDLAAAIETHPVYLARSFRESYGVTVGQYVRSLRLRHASELIAKTDMPLGEVAIEAGFSDQAHLTKTFREHVDVTPASYRRQYRA